MICRNCNAALTIDCIDLGFGPLSNAYLRASDLLKKECWYPLKVMVCGTCWLAQITETIEPDQLFTPDYAYFSSTSSSFVEHARLLAEKTIGRFNLSTSSQVVEIASNDGYLLQFFQRAGINCLGIEPARDAAQAARQVHNIEVVESFFGMAIAENLAQAQRSADIVIANNVLAHVPDLRDFVSGVATLLKPEGVVIFEFPTLTALISEGQFDTIYHEHFSYLSFSALDNILERNGLQLFDVEEIPTHGGSLRVYATHKNTDAHIIQTTVAHKLSEEAQLGVQSAEYYQGLQKKAQSIKYDLLNFLIEKKQSGKIVLAYGAAAKGNTLFNFTGIRPDLISAVIDRAPSKQDKFLPGSHIPILAVDELDRIEPDFVLILPWNIQDEIIAQNQHISGWGGQFVVAVPQLDVIRSRQ